MTLIEKMVVGSIVAITIFSIIGGAIIFKDIPIIAQWARDCIVDGKCQN